MLVASAVALAAHPAGAAGADAVARLAVAAADGTAFVLEAGDDDVPDDLAAEDEAGVYYGHLVLMRGQLHLGEELFRLGAREDARAHLATLAADHLPTVTPALRQRDLGRVVERVEQLADAARDGGSWMDLQTLYEATRMAIERAEFELDPSISEDPGFQARVLLGVARRAVEEYEAAVADGAIADETAYRMSYGFMRQGRRMLRAKAGVLGRPDDDLDHELVARYDRLMEASPSLRTPDEAPVPVPRVRERLDAFAAVVERY